MQRPDLSWRNMLQPLMLSVAQAPGLCARVSEHQGQRLGLPCDPGNISALTELRGPASPPARDMTCWGAAYEPQMGRGAAVGSVLPTSRGAMRCACHVCTGQCCNCPARASSHVMLPPAMLPPAAVALPTQLLCASCAQLAEVAPTSRRTRVLVTCACCSTREGVLRTPHPPHLMQVSRCTGQLPGFGLA